MTDVHPTAQVSSGAQLAKDVTVGPYTIISDDTTVGSGTEIAGHVVTEGEVVIGEDNDIRQGAIIGTEPQSWEIDHDDTGVTIGDRNIIREYVTVNRAMEESGNHTRIGDDNMIMAYCHVAHDCEVKHDTTLTNNVTLAGHVTIEEHVNIGGLTAFHQFVRVGSYSMIGGLSRINQDVVPFIRIAGNPAEVYDLNAIGLRRNGFSRDDRSALKEACNYLFHEGLNTSQALEAIRDDMELIAPVQQLIDFIEGSDRGIHK